MNRGFVDNIQTGNSIEAEKIFKNEIADKIGNALEVKRKEVSKTFVQSMEVENQEETNEV